MLHRSTPHHSPVPGRNLRVVIEDADLASQPLSVETFGIDVRVCSGPRCETDACPLVGDGACPMGRFDAAVSTLSGAWPAAIGNAWLQAGTVSVAIDPIPGESPADRFRRCLGAAVAELYRTIYADGDD